MGLSAARRLERRPGAGSLGEGMQESGLPTRRGGSWGHCCLTSEGLPGHSDRCRVASKADPGPLGGYFAYLLLHSNCPPNHRLISHGSVVERGQLRGSRLGLPRGCWGTWSAGLDEQVGPSHSSQLRGAEDGGSTGAATRWSPLHVAGASPGMAPGF